jgi:hypothetical protein
MAKQLSKTKKTDRDKPWNRRKSQSRVYAISTRPVNNKRFIIYCEGANTEPLYFDSFPVVTAKVRAIGLGRSKTSLVHQALAMAILEDRDKDTECWIVFDMDFDQLKDESEQHRDFNQAIELAKSNGFQVAYSNDAFELWFVLHYQLHEAALTRVEYYQKVSDHWEMSYERHGKGVQFCRTIYQRLLDDPKANQSLAIRNAERLFSQQEDLPPAQRNPCTTVYQLVSELNKYLKE